MLFLSDSNFQIVYLKKEKSTNMIQYESHIHDSASQKLSRAPCENKSAAAIFCLSDACKEQLWPAALGNIKYTSSIMWDFKDLNLQ